jgi:8-oxo-dGTP diphosphatase
MRYSDLRDWSTALSNAEVTIPFTLIACENAQGELLMLKRYKPPFVDMWNFLGGKIEPDERPDASARRELLEELGRAVAPRALKYRGVAFWPETADHEVRYRGMHLFYARLPAKVHSTGQLALLDEGVTAWLPKDLLARGDDFEAVPNFGVLYPIMVEAPDNAPQAVFHWTNKAGHYESASRPIRPDYSHPSSFPPGNAKVPVSALTGPPDTF